MRSNKFILSLVFTLVGAIASAQVHELYLKGVACSNRGEYNEAHSYLEEALSYDDDNSAYLLKLAEIAYRSGHNQQALEYLDRLEKAEPGKGSYLLACIHAAGGDEAATVKYLEIHLQSKYKLPPGKILLQEEFTSLENSKEWRRLWSNNWYTEDEELLQEIRYLNNSGESLQALEIVDERIGERERWDDLHAARGDILLKMKQFQGAIQSYTVAIEISSAHPEYFHGRAEAFFAQGKYEKAIADMEKASRMEPENLDILMEIGMIYRESGNFSKSIEYMVRYISYYPKQPESIYQLGQVYYDSEKYLDALEKFNICLKLATNDPRFYAARGKTYLKTRTYSYALNDLGMALDLDPSDHEVWYMKGLVRWAMNDQQGAFSDWKQAARLGSFEAARKLEENGITQ